MDLKGAWKKLCAAKSGPWLVAAALAMTFLSLTWEDGSEWDAASRQEARMGQVLSKISGAGQVEVALYYAREDAQAPEGAVIVAQGSRDIGVRLHLTRAAATLLGLDEDRICVFLMDEGGAS